MEYRDDIEKSAEYLRLALAHMGRHKAGMHPVSYAIWYEYVAGINPALRERIDALLEDGKELDDSAVHRLFRDHVAEIDAHTAQRVSESFGKVMDKVSVSTSQVAAEASQFGRVLERWSEDVAAGRHVTTPTHNAAELLSYSHAMRQTVRALHTRLEESHREVETLRKEVERAREEAMIDGLTGLTNRRGFDRALADHLNGNDGLTQGPSLLLADIDRFKRINDDYGHLCGDKVIRAVAKILRDNVKGKDIAARYGGEEFVVVLPETPVEGALHLAEKIRRTIEASRIKRVGSNEVVASVTISLGVASWRPGESQSELIARADRALYQSKQLGRNRVTPAAGA
ncbi:MAG: GGDEF domain-containing protein [Sulfuritalea sp.]|nr:GGDEF domain-containing protein [Sulfuritalea sp.]